MQHRNRKLIRAAQADGLIGVSADPFDVMAMVIAMSMAWSPVSTVYSASAAEERRELDRRRAFLRDAVRRAFPTA